MLIPSESAISWLESPNEMIFKTWNSRGVNGALISGGSGRFDKRAVSFLNLLSG